MSYLLLLAWPVYVVWIFVSMLLSAKLRAPVLEWAWLVLKWPALAACPAMWFYLMLAGSDLFILNAVYLVWTVWAWWQYSNSGDDDFRRRLKSRVAGKVQALAGRLVVVPT